MPRPTRKYKDYKPPTPFLPRSPGIHQEWLQGILEGRQPLASFDYAAPLTEAMLLGNVALRCGQRIDYDAAGMRVRNLPEAGRLLQKQYRRGFELPRL